MTNNLHQMEEFINLASSVLEEIKQTNEQARTNMNLASSTLQDANKFISFIKWAGAIVIIAFIGQIVRTEVGIAIRPTYNEVKANYIEKKDAITVHRLNVNNMDNNIQLLTDDSDILWKMRDNNSKYINSVEQIYNSN